jgi:hypothetical protein
MSVAARLALFGAAIVAVFAVASVAGAALDAGTGTGNDPANGEEAMGMTAADAESGDHTEMTSAAPAGLAIAVDGYRLLLDRDQLRVGEHGTLRFRIVGADGATVEDFDTEHERRMHFIVVRRDLSGFQHLHPEQLPDGSWRIGLTVEEAGDYRVYADFSTAGEPMTLGADVFVPGAFRPHPLPPERAVADAGDGYEVALSESGGYELSFTVSRHGRTLDTVEPYLGADGHLVVLRQGDGAFLHAHPLGEPGGSGPIEFMVEYPSAGNYRLFLQFKDAGVVHTAAFTKRNVGEPNV